MGFIVIFTHPNSVVLSYSLSITPLCISFLPPIFMFYMCGYVPRFHIWEKM